MALSLRAFDIYGVNLKSAASTLIVPAISGKRFLPRAIFMRIVSGSIGGFTVFQAKLGNASPFDIAGTQNFGTTEGAYIPNNLLEMLLNGSEHMFAADIGTTGLSFTVTTASNMTAAHTADVFIEGYII